MISAAFPYQKKRRRVLGREMAYAEVGHGDPIVLLHGNPTSSYLWRNVIPHLQPLGRCIAPDLIGMGDSDKLPNSRPGSYRFVEHRRYLDALLEALNVRERVTLVIHDWGSTLGFDWANRHRDAVKGMPGAMLRKLSDEEMAEYRRPFAEPGESRRPTLTWPREIPIEGDPADVTAIADAYADWLKTSSVPKLFLAESSPAARFSNTIAYMEAMVGRQYWDHWDKFGMRAVLQALRSEAGEQMVLQDNFFIEKVLARSLPAQTEVTVKGDHFVQEDSPDEIGRAVAGWMKTLG